MHTNIYTIIIDLLSQGIALSEKYFEKMNPDFLLTIVRDYLSFVSKEVRINTYT